MSTDVQQAFNAAAYWVDGDDRALELKIGGPCPSDLSRWIARYSTTAWLITADNPAATPLPEAINTARRDVLGSWVKTRQLAFRRCVNRDPSGDWPDEQALLIVGLEEGTARALARRFGQLAMVAIGVDRPIELIWL